MSMYVRKRQGVSETYFYHSQCKNRGSDKPIYKGEKIKTLWRLGVGRQGGVEKENKTLGTKRRENIKNLYVKNFFLIVMDYNQHMQRVDMADQMLHSCYRKTVKWTKEIMNFWL